MLTSQRIAGMPTPFGDLILDLDTKAIPVSVVSGGVHALPVALDADLAGLRFYMQAAVVSGTQGVLLTNGGELVIGTF